MRGLCDLSQTSNQKIYIAFYTKDCDYNFNEFLTEGVSIDYLVFNKINT